MTTLVDLGTDHAYRLAEQVNSGLLHGWPAPDRLLLARSAMAGDLEADDAMRWRSLSDGERAVLRAAVTLEDLCLHVGDGHVDGDWRGSFGRAVVEVGARMVTTGTANPQLIPPDVELREAAEHEAAHGFGF